MTQEQVPRIDFDGLYKKAPGAAATLTQFLQTFDPAMAAILRLDTIDLAANGLFARVPVARRSAGAGGAARR